MTALRILVADDHEIVRRGLGAILTSHAGWEVCGEVADGREAVEKTKQLSPDVVILNIGMPSLNGLDATRQILRHNPRQRVLILTVTDAEQVIKEVLKAGARGFVLKTDAAQDLTTAVEALQEDHTFFNSRVGEMVLNGFLEFRREVERELTGKKRSREIVYFKLYNSQIPVIEQALETAAQMLGSDRSRGYCLEMICADFLAGANLDSGDSDVLVRALTTSLKFLSQDQRQAFLTSLNGQVQ
jgi:DNA-binding NarL/FixJ family response regulator